MVVKLVIQMYMILVLDIMQAEKIVKSAESQSVNYRSLVSVSYLNIFHIKIIIDSEQHGLSYMYTVFERSTMEAQCEAPIIPYSTTM